MIVMNVFISILNDTFAEVQADLLAQENQYDMLDYMMKIIKNWIGLREMDMERLIDDDDEDEQSLSLSRNSSQRSTVLSRSSILQSKGTLVDEKASLDSTSQHGSIKSMAQSGNSSSKSKRSSQKATRRPAVRIANYRMLEMEQRLKARLESLNSRSVDDGVKVMDERTMKETAEKFVKALHIICTANPRGTKKETDEISEKKKQQQEQQQQQNQQQQQPARSTLSQRRQELKNLADEKIKGHEQVKFAFADGNNVGIRLMNNRVQFFNSMEELDRILQSLQK